MTNEPTNSATSANVSRNVLRNCIWAPAALRVSSICSTPVTTSTSEPLSADSMFATSSDLRDTRCCNHVDRVVTTGFAEHRRRGLGRERHDLRADGVVLAGVRRDPSQRVLH